MANYLVTGGCGFIGSHLCDRLLEQGHRVRVLDNLSTGHRENLSPDAELVIGDVADPACVAAAMDQADGCFHLAAIASVQRSTEDWIGTHRSNLTGAIMVFDAARRAERPGVKVVYASSAAVYGDNQAIPLRETAALHPLTAYGADKLGCELHAQVAALVHRVPTCGLRFFNVFGPRQDPRSPYSGVISIFVDRLLRGQSLPLFGDGRQQRDFVYVGDVVAHLLAAMEKSLDASPVFNVCRGEGISILDLADCLGRTLGMTPHLRFDAARPGDIPRSVGDPSLAIAGLGVRATTGLSTGLQTIIDHLRLSQAA